MGAFVFYPPPYFSSCKQSKLGKPIISLKGVELVHDAIRKFSFGFVMNTESAFDGFLNVAEIADRPAVFSSPKNPLHFSVSCIRSDGSRREQRLQKISAPGRVRKGDENEMPQLSDDKLSNSSRKQEIIALLRRIEFSISKGPSANTKKRNFGSAEERPLDDSIAQFLRQSAPLRKHVKDPTSKREGSMVISHRRDAQKIEREILDKDLAVHELNGKALTAEGEDTLPGIEEMKLSELKELAKSRGIKGYSRLKKNELVELLRS